jgi:hypothetical protein
MLKEIALVAGGIFLGRTLLAKGGTTPQRGYVPGEKGTVVEADFDEDDDAVEGEADDGYWVRIDGVTAGKVRRNDYTSDSLWSAGAWDADGSWVEGPDDLKTRSAAVSWVEKNVEL